MTDKVEKILSEIQTRKLCTMDEHMAFYNDKAKEDYEYLCEIEEFMKAFASEDLLKASMEFAKHFGEWHYAMRCFQTGAEWKKQQMMKEAVSATIVSDLDPHGADYGNQKIICGWGELEAKRFKNGSKVKLIIIKED